MDGGSIILGNPSAASSGAVAVAARIGDTSPATPGDIQNATTTSGTSFLQSVSSALKSSFGSLSNLTGAGVTQQAAVKVGNQAQYAAARASGVVGKAYNSAVASVDTAIINTAQTAQTVATGIKYGSMIVLLVLGVIAFATFKTSLKETVA